MKAVFHTIQDTIGKTKYTLSFIKGDGFVALMEKTDNNEHLVYITLGLNSTFTTLGSSEVYNFKPSLSKKVASFLKSPKGRDWSKSLNRD